MIYAYIEDNEVKRVGALPRSHKNVSGFNRLSNTRLKEHGFKPYEYNMPEYNQDTHKLGNLTYTIQASKVIGTNEVVALTKVETDSRKENVSNNVRSQIVEYLYKTDWTQLGNLEAEKESKFDNLRDLLSEALGKVADMSLADLNTLNSKLQACNGCLTSRHEDFSNEINELVSYLGV